MEHSIKKVGLVSRYPPVHCGVAEYTKMVVSALRSLNPRLEVYVFSTDEAGNEAWQDELGVHVIPCYPRFASDYSMLLNALSEVSVDVLHLQHEYGIYGMGREVINALSKAKEEGLAKKTVVTMHTVDHPYTERKDTLKFQASLNSVDAVIVHSPLQEFELQIQGVEAPRLHRIPHGTLINPYLCYTRSYLAKSLGLQDEFSGVVLAVPGFLRRDKGIDVLLDALEMLRDMRFTLLIAGESKDPKVHDLVSASTSAKTIIMEKYLSSDEILRVVALADAIVLPYRDRHGAYAVSGILHLSMGGLKPIVGSRTPRLVELYQFAPRLTVPPGEPGELARKIAWLVENYDYAVAYMTELYGYAARTQWIRMAHRHLKLYQNLLTCSSI
ncbi:glycosyltransferase [Archaeoglobus veneficus]|uniref:Glycosyl transferase group 1 n=1 Tax=Archaeoglobus veneficus (strain DSM 11195 / SNP6) TaxID=693661 RepID=F2KQR9_ARCVS|nr:glycosyltransferase [Archaeoglobus veneficus]AEA46631.1 glycosyl transferase group 1 [Archaeoglobus veneficus SNP6]